MSNFNRIIQLASKALGHSTASSSAGTSKTDWRELVRTAANKVTGDVDSSPQASRSGVYRPSTPPSTPSSAPVRAPGPASTSTDQAAIARYDYLLKTATPHQLEQMHRDAFAGLDQDRREQVRSTFTQSLPASEWPASAGAEDLARSATRAEMQKPGLLRRLLAHPGATGAVGLAAGAGLGAVGGLLAAVAGGAVLSGVALPILDQALDIGIDFDSSVGDLGEFGFAPEDYAAGLGDQLSEAGSGFDFLGLGTFFDRD